MRYWIRVKLLKTGKLCYSIIWETSLRKTLQPCKFIEWNRIKKIIVALYYVSNHNITTISCFPSEAARLKCQGRNSRLAIALRLGERRKNSSLKSTYLQQVPEYFTKEVITVLLQMRMLSQGDEVPC